MFPFRKLREDIDHQTADWKKRQEKRSLGHGGDQEKHGEMVKGKHRDGRHGNPAIREQGGRALEGKKSTQRISFPVSVCLEKAVGWQRACMGISVRYTYNQGNGKA